MELRLAIQVALPKCRYTKRLAELARSNLDFNNNHDVLMLTHKSLKLLLISNSTSCEILLARTGIVINHSMFRVSGRLEDLQRTLSSNGAVQFCRSLPRYGGHEAQPSCKIVRATDLESFPCLFK